MNSMTGFGRGSHLSTEWLATVEIASVNRKQAEVVVQSPRELNELEPRIRKTVLDVVSRGRIQVSITLQQAEGTAGGFHIDRSLAESFTAALRELEKIAGNPLPPTAADFIRQPGMLTFGGNSLDADTAWATVAPALDEALGLLTAMRRREGDDLRNDFLTRLKLLTGFAATIVTQGSSRPERQRDLLSKRLRDAGLDINPTDELIAREIAIFADRCDISEEVTRLDSHFSKFHEYLVSPEPCGRALDFLCQELFREFNTIGSKANDAAVAQTVVEAKTELERIREQVQNVE